MTDVAAALEAIAALIGDDVSGRLGADAASELRGACPDDFRQACLSLAEADRPALVIVTGFFIPTGQPPGGETDGPLGAIFLARALRPLGMRIVLATDDFCARAMQAGINQCGVRKDVPLVVLPRAEQAGTMNVSDYYQYLQDRAGAFTHLLAIERPGPSHTQDSLRQQGASPATIRSFIKIVPPEQQDRYHTMRGRDISGTMSPAHRLFESADRNPDITTIGIGDGGNEIGMGKLSWDLLQRHIAVGSLIACRIPTRHLIVSGVSNASCVRRRPMSSYSIRKRSCACSKPWWRPVPWSME
jgi:hypothetical protein